MLSMAVAASTGRVLDPLVFVALVSALEGVSMELLRREPSEKDIERACAVLNGVLSATLEHSALLPVAASILDPSGIE
jgi:hypothetical protein